MRSGALLGSVPVSLRCLNLVTTAEGVEMEQQKKQLRIPGCTEMQDYLLSPPICRDEVTRMFDARAEARRGAA
jgi:EAL domain-containing protein (putative c-di-GMP-specific phosphodiesterase class I)